MDTAEHQVTRRFPEGRDRRPRPPWTAVALVAAVTAALLAAGVAMWDGGGETVKSEQLPGPPTTAAPPSTPTTVADPPATSAPPATAGPATTGPATTRPTTPPTTAAPRRLADSRLSLDGIGPVDIGMTLDEANAAAGTTIRLLGPRDPEGDCVYGRADSGPEGLLFMFINGRIARVDVGGAGPSAVKTVSGVGIGSTEAEVQRTYPGRIRVTGHPYVQTGRYLIYVPNDPAWAHLSMIFETDGARVTSFRAGLAGAVAQIEGCS